MNGIKQILTMVRLEPTIQIARRLAVSGPAMVS
jgi:hypothetical protein